MASVTAEAARCRSRRLLKQAGQGKLQVLVPAIVFVELTLLRETGRRVVGPAEVQAVLAEHGNF